MKIPSDTSCLFSDIINNKSFQIINEKYKTEQVPKNVNLFVCDMRDNGYKISLCGDCKRIPILEEEEKVTSLIHRIHLDMQKYAYIDFQLERLLNEIDCEENRSQSLLNFLKENGKSDYYICLTLHVYALNVLIKRHDFFELLLEEFIKKQTPFESHINTIKRLVKKCVDQNLEFEDFKNDPYEHFLKLDTSSTQLFKIIDSLACDCELATRLEGVARFILHINESIHKNTRMSQDETLESITKTTSYLDIKALKPQEKIQMLKDTSNFKFFSTNNEKHIALKETFNMEKELSEYFKMLCHRSRNTPSFNSSELYKTLTPEQKEAVKNAFVHGISCLTGGPGTGKSMVIGCIREICNTNKKTILITAPTGRASSQLVDGKTCHKVIKTKKITIPDLVIIDETSMLDLKVCHMFFKRLKFNKRINIILVGDADQLPSIGCGEVFKDVLKSGIVPFVKLNKNHRNDNSIGESSQGKFH